MAWGAMSWRVNVLRLLLLIALVAPFVVWLNDLVSIVGMAVSQLVLIIAAVLMRPAAQDLSLTGLDAVMINLDRLHSNQTPAHGQIVGVLYVERCPTKTEAVKGLQALVIGHKRFRSVGIRANSCLDSCYLTKEPKDIDIEANHVGEWTADGPAAVERVVEDLANSAPDMTLPMWKFDLISNVGVGDSVVMIRANHCLADGLRMLKATGTWLQFEDGSPADVGLLARMSERKRKVGNEFGVLGQVGRILSGIQAVARLPGLPAETRTCLHEPKRIFAGENRRSLARSAVPFAVIKQIKDACPKGTTVNDVVLTALCGALRRYMQSAKDPAVDDPGLLLRAFCAVALPDMRRREAGDELHNSFVMPSFSLAVAQSDRMERLAASSASMRAMKSSMEGLVTMAVNSVLVRLGAEGFIGKTMLDTFGNHSFVYSNVPGFEAPVFVFGTNIKVKGINVYYPNLISQVICLSYVDTFSFSLITDSTICKDPAMLAQLFEEEVTDWADETACS